MGSCCSKRSCCWGRCCCCCCACCCSKTGEKSAAKENNAIPDNQGNRNTDVYPTDVSRNSDNSDVVLRNSGASGRTRSSNESRTNRNGITNKGADLEGTVTEENAIADNDVNLQLEEIQARPAAEGHTNPALDPETGEGVKLRKSSANVVVKAKYDYVAVEGKYSDLGFKKGDRMRKHSRGPDNGWVYVEHLFTKKRGYVPETYIVEDNDDHTSEDWWFECSRIDAERCLKQPGVPAGAFMVRPSRSRDTFALSVLDTPGGVAKHYRIATNTKGEFYINPQETFLSLNRLIKAYKGKASTYICCTLRASYEVVPEIPPFRDIEIERDSIVLGDKLGNGQFGDVYRGMLSNHTEVAVKVLKENKTSKEEFLKEAQVMHKLKHKRLMPILGVCTKDIPMYIVTEFMVNGSLVTYLRKSENKDIENNILLDMAAQIAEGMAYLEGRKFVHRDLRASNILVGKNYTVKVADFGLARFCNSGDVHRATILIDETAPKFPVRWTAPECMDTYEFTTKSDVWSFGVLLYELFTKGKVPYLHLSTHEVMLQVMQGYVIEKPYECCDKVYALMRRCWDQEPDKRPTFAYLHSHFESYLASIEPDEPF